MTSYLKSHCLIFISLSLSPIAKSANMFIWVFVLRCFIIVFQCHFLDCRHGARFGGIQSMISIVIPCSPLSFS